MRDPVRKETAETVAFTVRKAGVPEWNYGSCLACSYSPHVNRAVLLKTATTQPLTVTTRTVLRPRDKNRKTEPSLQNKILSDTLLTFSLFSILSSHYFIVFYILYIFFKIFLNLFLQWPGELRALQLKKTHAKRQNKLRKHLHQFDNMFPEDT